MATLTQLPDPLDLSFVAGDTFRIRVRVIAQDTGDPEALAEYTFCAEIAQNPDRAIVAQFEVAPDPDNPTTGVVLTLTPTETASLPGMGTGAEFHGIWDLEVKFPSGDVRTVVKGTVTCILDVSNCEG